MRRALARPVPDPVTAACFPIPGLILRTTDPAAQHSLREFAAEQAQAARRLHQMLAAGLRHNPHPETRAAVFTLAFTVAEDWRYRVAVAGPHPAGRYSASHTERFRTPVTGDNPNLFRIGDHQRFRDGAVWDPAARTYRGGAETPASQTMQRAASLAAARFTHSPGADVVINQVTLTGGSAACGMRLLRGTAARHAAATMATRIVARGGDTSRVNTDGDPIYVSSGPDADRRAIFHEAMTLLAHGHTSRTAALAAWLRAAYLLYQAPRRKRGSDATIRTFLIAAGVYLLDRPPVLLHDIDLRAYVRPHGHFVAELHAAQTQPKAEGPLS